MSMNARFVQVEQAQLEQLIANPSGAEMVFQDGDLMPPVFAALAHRAQERARAMGPEGMAQAIERLDPRIREQLEASMGRLSSTFGPGVGVADMFKMLQERLAARAGGKGEARASISLDKSISLEKAWHGVHYLLCGEVEPGTSLLSQVVMGGTPLGDDDEGFAGYGPARYFSVEQVGEISAALSDPDVESQAAQRFDAQRMEELEIYPGWRVSDKDWVMGELRRLRDFYSDAARNGRAMVTCLV